MVGSVTTGKPRRMSPSRCRIVAASFAIALASGCSSPYGYPNTAVGRYCRHAIETCGEPARPADCVSAFNAELANTLAGCQATYNAELECQATAACSGTTCSTEHEATNQCIASGGMGGGI